MLPGFRLNLSKSGMSATVGIKGLSLNVGQNGVYLNTGMPGTGIYDRTKLGHNEFQNHQSASTENEVEVKKFQPELFTSEGMFGIKESIIKAREVKSELKRESEKARRKKNKALFLSCVAHLFVFGIFVRWFRDNYRSAKADAKDAEQSYKDFRLDIDFDMDQSMLDDYTVLKNGFEKLAASKRIWEITVVQAIDRIKQRSSASASVERIPVRFSLNSVDYINSKHEALKLQNTNGGDLYLYPGFIVMPSKRNNDFSIIDLRDIQTEYHAQKFVETDSMPSDARVIDYTWQYVNKNGSPDRRYSNNPRIPVMLYYSLTLKSSKGLHEEFLFSNARSAEAFCEAFDRYRDSLIKMNWCKDGSDDCSVPTFTRSLYM